MKTTSFRNPVRDPKLPSFRTPRYNTGGKLYTRHDLLDLLIDQFGSWGVGLDEVNSFIRVNRLQPVDYVKMVPMTPVDDFTNDSERHRIVAAYEQTRTSSKPHRARFDIDGLPMHVPSIHMPSEGDDPDVIAAKISKIESLTHA